MSQVQAIVKVTKTISATFSAKPSDDLRGKLKASGAEYRNGQWVRSIPDGAIEGRG